MPEQNDTRKVCAGYMKRFVDISYDDAEYSKLIDEPGLTKWIKRVMKVLALKGHSCSVVFTDNENIRELNKKYFGKDRPTNVLSFSQVEGEGIDFIHSKFLGDIVISVPYVIDFSKGSDHSFGEEIEFLALHGILHLLGYDHETDEGAMDDKQAEIYRKLTGIILE